MYHGRCRNNPNKNVRWDDTRIEVRYVPQLKRNLISVGVVETLGLVVSIKDGVLKMTKGSMVVLKAVRQNNLYYPKGSTVTGQVATSTDSGDDSTRL